MCQWNSHLYFLSCTLTWRHSRPTAISSSSSSSSDLGPPDPSKSRAAGNLAEDASTAKSNANMPLENKAAKRALKKEKEAKKKARKSKFKEAKITAFLAGLDALLREKNSLL